MVDIHRHLPLKGESKAFPEWSIWYASSSMDEWEILQQRPQENSQYHGYGLLAQSLDDYHSVSVSTICQTLFEALEQDQHGYVGEIGIDTRYTATLPLDFQITLATELLQVAKSLKRPCVIHHVGPIPLLERLIKSVAPSIPVIIHGYLTSVESARKLASLGATISLGPPVWTKNTNLARQLTNLDVPFLIETDYPFTNQGELVGISHHDLLKRHLQQIANLMHRDPYQLEEQIDGFATLFTNW